MLAKNVALEVLEDGHRATAANRHGLQVSRYDYSTAVNGNLNFNERAADTMEYSDVF